MQGTFSQLYIQAVFAVKGRDNLLHPAWRQEAFKYMAGILKNKGQKPIIVNGMSDHAHLLFGLKPVVAIADVVRDVKNNASNFINDHHWVRGRFAWQEGYGAFSYSHTHVQKVYDYILNQEEHHRVRTFREEYLAFLQKFQIEYDEKYVFDFIEDSALTPENGNIARDNQSPYSTPLGGS